MEHAQDTSIESVTAPTQEPCAEPPTAPKFLNPSVPEDMVVRRRLVDLLEQGTLRWLTLVSAPAGYGKTALVASWSSRADVSRTVVHMTMDDGDEAPRGFWSSVLEALHSSGVDISHARLTGSFDVDRSTITRLGQCIEAQHEPVIWVLDCGEFTLAETLGDQLNRLVEACRGRLRLVLLTRTEPSLPLHRYRLDGEITEIRAADLAFTATEVTKLMRRAGLDLAPADVSALRARTGGWPAGLRFAAMSLAGRVDARQAIREFRGDTGNVAAYLMGEVLAKQPPEMHDFLLRTCLVDDLEPGLVGELTGQPCDARALQFMARGNAFIETVPGRPDCYRYQSLFREFLRSQLSFEAAAIVPELHRRAADWLVHNGQRLAGIRHAVWAEDWPLAAGYLVDDLGFAGLLTGCQRPILKELFARLPADAPGAEAAVTRAAVALAELDHATCTSELGSARVLLSEQAPPRSRACELAIVVLEAVALSVGGDLDAGLDSVLAAEIALQGALARDLAGCAELKTLVAGCKGSVLFERGDFAEALLALSEGVKAARALQLEESLTNLQGMVALVQAVTGHLRRATENATHLGVGADSSGADVAFTSQAATVALAWVRTDECDLQVAQELVSYSEKVAPSYDARVVGAVQALIRARLLGAHGEHELARAELRAARTYFTPSPATGWLDRFLVIEQAASLVAEGKPDAAVAMCQPVVELDDIDGELVLERAALACGESPSTGLAVPAPVGTGRLEVQVNTWLVQAEQSIASGNSAHGEVCIERALRLASPERLRRPFFEASPEVRALLERSVYPGSRRWLETGGAVPGADSASAGPDQGQSWVIRDNDRPSPVVNPLSKKEQEVLGYLAELLTTEEIAATMFVSVNTVRSHVRSILRKLDVTRRNEAVRRAWDLKLLPPRSVA